MMQYAYFTCDVFTDSAFGGNPLAVFPEAAGLTSAQMQRIAREFNYSETTFVLPPQSGHTRQVRIFTPTREVPFAGHPNVGTAYVLTEGGFLDNPAPVNMPGDLTVKLTDDMTDKFTGEFTVEFEEQAGVVPVVVQRLKGRVSCELRAPEGVSIDTQIPADLVAGALSLSPVDILTSNHEPQVVSVGLPFILVEVPNQEVLGKVEIDVNYLKKIQQLDVMPDLHVYCRSDGEFDLRTRMFAPLDGIVEDPATGSANCALAGLLATLVSSDSGKYRWRIAQGVEMGRPSVLNARAHKIDGKVVDTWIGGESVMMMHGTISVPDPA